MLTMRCWTRAERGDGVSPFGDQTNILRDYDLAVRVFESVSAWCGLNGQAFRIGICDDISREMGRMQTNLVEIGRVADGDLVHVTYVEKPWDYMHVLFASHDRPLIERMQRRFIDVGKGVGRCENSARDLPEVLRKPPFYLYVLTGRLPAPPKRFKAPTATAQAPAPSLLSLLDG